MNRIPDYNEEAVTEAWKRFVQKRIPLPQRVAGVRQMILDSWKRSQKTAARDLRKLPRVSPDALRGLLRENDLLIRIAYPYLERFWQYISDSGHQITLADRNGVQLRTIGNFLPGTSCDESLADGTDFSEKIMGTNGIGTALAVQKPVMIYGAEHFSPLYHSMACYAAPLYDPAGALLGCINITGPLALWEPMIMGVLQTAAAGIQREFLLTQKNRMLGRLIESFGQGAVMLDNENNILFCNQLAGELLKAGKEQLRGKSIYSFIERDSIPEAIRDFRAPITGEDLSLVSASGKSIDISLTVRPADPSSHGMENTLLFFHSQGYVHRLTSRLAGFSAVCHFDSLAGASPASETIVSMGKFAAEKTMPVLLVGEPGTGRRVLAQAIHNAGPCPDRPFVEMDCTAAPNSVLVRELFGCTRRETGSRLPGRLELARGGTLYLDRVSALPMDMQEKLVSLLREEHPGKPSFRLIASTDASLFPWISKGAFREDLYYMLHAFTITLPPLRERPEDIPLLAERFVRDETGRSIPFTEEAKQALCAYSWPGNTRELENTIRLCARRQGQAIIELTDLPWDIQNVLFEAEAGKKSGFSLPAETGSRPKVKQQTKAPASAADARNSYLFSKTLSETNGSVSDAAAKLGLPASTLYRRLAKLGIRARDFRAV